MSVLRRIAVGGLIAGGGVAVGLCGEQVYAHAVQAQELDDQAQWVGEAAAQKLSRSASDIRSETIPSWVAGAFAGAVAVKVGVSLLQGREI